MRFLVIVTLFCGTVLFLFPQLVWMLTALAGKVFSFKVAYKPFLWVSLGLLCAFVLAMAYGYFVGRTRLDVKEVDLHLENLPAAFDGYRIVQISDIHLDGMKGCRSIVDRAVDTINALQPDMICMTGDLVSLVHNEIDAYAQTLSRLEAKDGVFSVLGNHDYSPYSRFESDSLRLEAVRELVRKEREVLGWHLLMNESAVVRRGQDSLAVVGVENQSCGVHPVVQRGDLSKAMAGTEGMFRILLSHDPSHWRAEVLPASDIPLTLSGHTHAMQLRFFGWSPAVWAYPECDGLYDNGDGRYLYVNIGLGGSIPFRLGAAPEITVIRLHRQ